MIWLTKKSKLTYFCVLVPMFLITVFYGIVQQNSTILLSAFVFFFAFSCLIKRVANSELELANKRLMDDLDYTEYIKFYEDATNSKRTDDTSFQMKSALVAGYIAAGDFEKAEPLFHELRGYVDIPTNADKHINPLSACINYLLYTGQLNEAYDLLLRLFECNNLLPDRFPHKNAAYNVLWIKYLCAANQLDNIEAFNNVYEGTSSLYVKLQLRYFLGCYYEGNSQRSDAVAAFEYVSANGKDLYIAQKAKVKLQLLNSASD